MSFSKFINELRMLNPNTDIRYNDIKLDKSAKDKIFSNEERLKLPDGFFYDNEYIVDTKGLKRIKIESIDNINDFTFPYVDINEELDDYSLENVASRIQELNPDVRVRLVNPIIGRISQNLLFIDVDIDDLALPSDFNTRDDKYIYHEDNTFIKNNITIKVDNIDDFSEIFLVETGYNITNEKNKQKEYDKHKILTKNLSDKKNRM